MDAPEQWKKYDDTYWVSDQGRVKRIFKNGNVSYLSAVPRSSHVGDRTVRVKIHNRYVVLNKLVWKVFRGEIPDGYTVVNKSGYYTVNNVYNLRLVKLSVCKDASESKGKKVIDLQTGIVYPSCRYLARKLGISHLTIIKCCNHLPIRKEYPFEYYDETKRYSGLNVRFIRRRRYD